MQYELASHKHRNFNVNKVPHIETDSIHNTMHLTLSSRNDFKYSFETLHLNAHTFLHGYNNHTATCVKAGNQIIVFFRQTNTVGRSLTSMEKKRWKPLSIFSLGKGSYISVSNRWCKFIWECQNFGFVLDVGDTFSIFDPELLNRSWHMWTKRCLKLLT